MARIVNRKQKCRICGNESEQSVMLSYFVDERYLDGYSTGDEKYLFLLECPSCHYVAVNLEKADEDDKTLIDSKEYLEISKEKDDLLRKLKLFAYLAERKNNYRKKAYANLLLYWYFIDKNQDGSEYLKKYYTFAEKSFESIENQKKLLYKIIQYIDLLRQGERYEDAESIIKELKQKIINTEYYDKATKRILTQEEKYIVSKDHFRHIIEE